VVGEHALMASLCDKKPSEWVAGGGHYSAPIGSREHVVTIVNGIYPTGTTSR
jgi:hypothetical protein